LRAELAPGADISRGLSAVEEVYRMSGGEHGRVPWAHAKANPALVAWLNARASGIVRCGARVAVVGCGLGADAIELVKRGYDVCAFDACASAIEHAKALHPQHASIFRQCDLRDMPSAMRHRYDLVVEIHTLQSMPPEHRATLASGIEPLLSGHGRLLVIARGRPDDEPLETLQGPPYPFTPDELTALLADRGLVPETPLDDYQDDQSPPARRLRGLFARA
jgi:SAM-dependent methyltransferase